MNISNRCKTATSSSKIVCEEKASKITFVNASHQEVIKILVDGCAITEGARCDYLVLNGQGKEHFVELKGSDVSHAVEQLEASINILSANPRSEKLCFIVSSRCPLLTTKIQDLKARFKKKYNATLIIKSRIYEHNF